MREGLSAHLRDEGGGKRCAALVARCDCPLFRLVEIKHTDLGFAAAGSSSVFFS